MSVGATVARGRPRQQTALWSHVRSRRSAALKPADDSDDEYKGLAEWTADKTLLDVASDLRRGNLSGVPLREIPLSNVNDLYLLFLASCETSGIAPAPSRFTFARSWHEAWSKVLKFRYPSSHTQCQTCFELSEHTYRAWASLEDKLAWARLWKNTSRGNACQFCF